MVRSPRCAIRPSTLPGLPLVLLLALVGCGGGGGGGGEAPIDGGGSGGGGTPTEVPRYAVGGSVLIPDFTQVDADVADVGGSGVLLPANDTFNSAQAVPNPAIVGGYLSGYPGDYDGTGLLAFPRDRVDIYRLNLLADQRIRITVYRADATGGAHDLAPDVDLSLWDQGQTLLEEQVGVDSSASFTAPTAGEYYLRLQTLGAPLTYTLVVGETRLAGAAQGRAVQSNATEGSVTLADRVPPQAAFVPGEAIITYRPEATAALSLEKQPLPGVFIRRFDATGRHGLLRLDKAMTPMPLKRPATSPGSAAATWSREETLAAIAELRRRPDVLQAEPNYIRRAMSGIDDNPLYIYQWHYPLVNLPAAWEVPGATGSGVKIAVLDTGVLSDHPDLVGRLSDDGYDFVSSAAVSLDGNGYDADPSDPGDSPIGESSFHGTHVIGTIVAANNTVGGLGVAFDAQVMPLRVLGQDGSGTDADLIQAIRYAAGLSNAAGVLPTTRADIINMSLGGPGASASLEAAVNAAHAAGVIVIAAAGNENTSIPSYPAAYTNVVSVSAVGANRQRAPYSNFGATIDVAAPGGNMLVDRTGDGRPDGVLSTWGDDSAGSVTLTWSLMQGTSMAAPHVAGIAAIMASLRRQDGETLTPVDFRSYLENGDLTLDLGASGRDDLYGFGLIDAVKAITAVDARPFPALVASETNLVFTQSGTTALTLTLAPGISQLTAGTETLDGGSWLTVSDTGDGDERTWQVAVDTIGLSVGLSYPGSVTFDYTADNGTTTTSKRLTVRVTVTLPDPSASVNAGRHYIILVEPGEDGETVQQDIADALNGQYAFDFSQVERGDYLLLAGSDLDNDGFICDAGEACAIYPVRNLVEPITVDRSLVNLEFVTGFLESFEIGSLAVAAPASTAPGPAGLEAGLGAPLDSASQAPLTRLRQGLGLPRLPGSR